MKILLTGSTGYLGLHVLTELVGEGHQVGVVARSPERLGPLVQKVGAVVSADLLDVRWDDVLAGHDALVHCAVIWGAPGTELELQDTIAAVRLFEAAGRAGVRRVVLVSSTAVHRPFAGVMTEGDAVTTADVYGATKASAELFLWAACNTHGMQGVVLRAAPIVGPPAFPGGSFRSDHRLAAMVEAARRGDPLEVVSGEGRQFVAAADVATAITRVVERAEARGTYLCVEREITPWEWIGNQAVALAHSSSRVIVRRPATSEMPPWFDGSRLATLLGRSFTSREAMAQHLSHLCRA